MLFRSIGVILRDVGGSVGVGGGGRVAVVVVGILRLTAELVRSNVHLADAVVVRLRGGAVGE